MKLSLRILTAIVALSIFGVACKKKTSTPTPAPVVTSNEMHFNFHNYFGSDEIVMNTGEYTTAQNEKIKISMFNYWITNIKLIKADGSEYVENESYRLVRGDKNATHHFHIKDVPNGTYKGVKFMIGVDVPRNTSGAQTGALDPAINADMFWTWNTGYIQAKLEGTFMDSNNMSQNFRHHIGGVATGMETPREVTLNFPNNIELGDKAGSIKIKTDATKWFGPSTPIRLAMMANMMHPNAMAAKIADNYKEMFSISSAGNE